MSYNNSNNNRKNFNNRKNGNFNKNNRNNSQNNVKRQEVLDRQNKSLDMIEAVAGYLDSIIANTGMADTNTIQKITMKDILNYLTTEKGFAQDDTKTVSQINYTLMDLANAQRSGYITGNRINIRILYIQERMKTSFRKELYTRIDKIMESYYNLFLWNEEGSNESIEIVTTQEEGEALTPVVEEKTVEAAVEATEESASVEETVENKEEATNKVTTENISE